MPDARNALLTQIDDFHAEASALAAVLEDLSESRWQAVTTFKSWTVWDVCAHLHMGDWMGIATLERPADYQALAHARRDSPLDRLEFTRQWLGPLSGARLLERWREGFETLCERFRGADPGRRLAWSGPGMRPRMFVTARQMETWAHGTEVRDLLGLPSPASARLHNIATLGVRTYGWTFANRGLTPPGAAPRVVLNAPGGGTWRWHEDNGESSVHGDALDFCQVVTQVRNVADVRLRASGQPATAWLSIAQCFAGPPEDPPAAGARLRKA